MFRVLRSVLGIGVLIALCGAGYGCSIGPGAQRERPATSGAEPGAIDALRGARVQLNDESHLLIYVYRSGALAHLGHNHVIRAPLHGEVSRTDGRFIAVTEPARWRIDDPVDRAAAGADFESVPSAKDIEGTRANLLGDRLLRVAEYPQLVITGQVTRNAGQQSIDVTYRVAGQTRAVRLTVNITLDDTQWRVSGQQQIAQTALGLTPFSVLGGALAVQDEMTVLLNAEIDEATPSHE